MTDLKAADEYRMSLAAVDRDCEHPEPFRRPIPNFTSDDPNEWECSICGMQQVYDPWIGRTRPVDRR